MKNNKRALMILGASYSQVPLIEAAKELGYKTVVATMPGDYEGIKKADSVFYGDLRNPEQILKGAKENNINGIATCCMDTGIQALGYVCDQMNLKGLSKKAGLISSNKADMKKAFVNYNVNTARYKKVSSEIDLKNAMEELDLPVIVKAVDLQGSLGIYIARTYEEVFSSFKKTMELTNEIYCVVEEFIEGNEFGAQAFIYEGEILYVLLHNDLTFAGNTAIPIGHSMPFEGNEVLKKDAIEQSKLAIKAVGLDNCAVNIDLIEKDGKVYVIELTGRIGATCLPDLVNTYYDINVYKMIVLAAMGENPKEIFEKRNLNEQPCYAEVLLSEKSGKVIELRDLNENIQNIVDVSFNITIGSEVKAFRNSGDRIGQVILKGKDLNECTKLLKEIKEKLIVKIE